MLFTVKDNTSINFVLSSLIVRPIEAKITRALKASFTALSDLPIMSISLA